MEPLTPQPTPKKPPLEVSTSETGQTPKKSVQAEREVEVGHAPAPRAKTDLQRISIEVVKQDIENLKGNSGFASWFIGSTVSGITGNDAEKESLIDTIQNVKKDFEQYKEVKITIPPETAKFFEDPPKAANLSDDQVAELVKLAMEGDGRLEEKKRLKSIEKEQDLGMFQHPDIVTNVLKHLEKPEDCQAKLAFLSISERFRNFLDISKRRVIITSNDIINQNNGTLAEKLQYAKKANLKLKIELQNESEIQSILEFLKSTDNVSLLENLEVFQINFDVFNRNMIPIQRLINQVEVKCPNLKLFSFGNLEGDLSLTINKPIAVTCRNIINVVTLKMDNITEFSCENISGVLLLHTNNLSKFSCTSIGYSSWRSMPASLRLSNKNLENLSIGYLYSNAGIKFEPDSFNQEESSATKLDNLTEISYTTIEKGARITLPEKLPKLKTISGGTINDPAVKATFDKLQANIPAQPEL